MLQQETLETQGMINLRMCFSAKLKMQQLFRIVVIQAVLLLSQLEIWYWQPNVELTTSTISALLKHQGSWLLWLRKAFNGRRRLLAQIVTKLLQRFMLKETL